MKLSEDLHKVTTAEGLPFRTWAIQAAGLEADVQQLKEELVEARRRIETLTHIANCDAADEDALKIAARHRYMAACRIRELNAEVERLKGELAGTQRELDKRSRYYQELLEGTQQSLSKLHEDKRVLEAEVERLREELHNLILSVKIHFKIHGIPMTSAGGFEGLNYALSLAQAATERGKGDSES